MQNKQKRTMGIKSDKYSEDIKERLEGHLRENKRQEFVFNFPLRFLWVFKDCK